MPTQAMQALSDFQGDHLSVPMFAGGASIWDGVTDATAALTAALAAKPGGGTVFLPGGTYLVSKSIPWHGATRLIGDRFNQAIILIAPNFTGNSLFTPIGPDFFDGELSDLAIQNPHDQVVWVVNAPALTSYVRCIHRRLSIMGLNGWTLTALGSGFIGATRNCVWEDVLLWSNDYDLSAAWNGGTAYAAGDIRNYGIPAKPYQAIDANTGQQPDVSPTHWKLLENCYTDVAYQVNQGDLNVWRRCQVTGTGRGIHTTVASSIGTGSQVVTPVNVKNIQVNSRLGVMNGDGSNFEFVIVTAQSGGTFTATFTLTHTGPGIRVDGQIRVPFSTTVAVNISNSPNQVVAPASMAGIAAGTLFWIANADGSNQELVRASAADASTFTITLLNGTKTGPGITVTGPVEDPFIEIRAGSQNQFYDLEPSPATPKVNINKPRMMCVTEINLVIHGFFDEEIKVLPPYGDAASEYGIFLFECALFQFTGQTRPDPYRRIWFSRCSGVIESLMPGFFGGVNDFLEQYIGFDTNNVKSSVLLRELYVEQNKSVRTLAWADKGLIIDRVTNSFDLLGHRTETNVPTTNWFNERSTQNLFVNPSFEGGLYGYLCNDGGAVITFPAAERNVGNMLKAVLSSSGGKLIEQQIPIVITAAMANCPLTFTALVKMTATVANPATTQSRVSVSLLGISGLPSAPDPTNYVYANAGWCRIVQTFIPLAAGNLDVGININCDGADSAWTVFTDDWCLSVGSVGGVDSSRFGSLTLGGQSIVTTSNGNPPGYGTWKVGDICVDQTGAVILWRCIVAGTPGTWADNLTGQQLTLQAAAGTSPSIRWITTGVAASPTEIQIFMSRASNDMDWTLFSYDGTTFRTWLQLLYNSGDPYAVMNGLRQLFVRSLEIQGVAGNTMPIHWSSAAAASATDVQYWLQRAANNTDMVLFGYDGTHFPNFLQLIYNSGAPYIALGCTGTGSGAVAVLFPGVTASRPLKVDSANKLLAALIDLGSASDVAGTGLTTNKVPMWDGSKLVDASSSAFTLPNTGTPGTYTKVTFDAQGRETSGATADLSGSDVTGILAAARFPALTGDITTSAGSLATTLKNIGTSGSYSRVATDSQGRVTFGTDLGISVTITTAKLTPGGANGSMTFTNGILTSSVAAT